MANPDNTKSGAVPGGDKPKPRPPSWFKPKNDSPAKPANQVEIAAAAPVPGPGVADECDSSVSVSSVPGRATAEPAPEGGEVLLGAPVSSDDPEVDDLLASAICPSEIESAPSSPQPSPLEPLATSNVSSSEPGTVASPAAESAPEAAEKASEAIDKPEAGADSSALEQKRLLHEVEHLTSIVNSVESLSYLLPRLKRMGQQGADPRDMVGLYRIVSQVLLEHLLKQAETMHTMRSDFDKKFLQMQEELVFGQSEELVKAVVKGQSPARQRIVDEQPKPAETESEPTSREDSSKISVLRKQLEIKDELLLKAREECEEVQKRHEKMAQDVKNIRARLEKDLTLQLQRAKESLFKKLLPVMDSFDGALSSSSSFLDIASVIAGLSGIREQLMQSCGSEGLEVIEAQGEQFDPNFHEAMGDVETNDVAEEHVYDEVRRGYMLNGKLLRAAMVRVAKALPSSSASQVDAAVASSEPPNSTASAAPSQANIPDFTTAAGDGEPSSGDSDTVPAEQSSVEANVEVASTEESSAS